MDGTSFRHRQRRRRYCDSNMRSEEGNPLMSRAKGLCLKTNIGSLSDDLLFQILQLLPADFLYEKARFVCRTWYEIIHSEDFTNAQIRRSTCGLLLLPIPNSHPIFVTAISGQIHTYKLSYKCRTRHFHTCNGLLVDVLHYHNERAAILKVVNPATKQQFLVPPVPMLGDGEFYKQECHIAYSAASKENKLVLEYLDEDDENRAGIKIVTARVDKSWRNVPIHHLSDDLMTVVAEISAVVTEGFLHWVGKRRVLTLNVETETFTYSETPESYPCYVRLRPLSGGRYLSVLCGGREVWEMKPESGEWRNLLPLMIDLRQFASEHRELVSPLGWVKYNLVTHKIDTIDLHHSNQSVYRASPHMNNFAWLS